MCGTGKGARQTEPYPDGMAEPDHQLFDLQQQVVVGAVVLEKEVGKREEEESNDVIVDG